MLQGFRDKIQGGLAKVIIVLICIPFAFFGIESFFKRGVKSEVAEVGSATISQSDLDEAVFLRKRQLLNQMGENIDYTQLEEAKLREPALKQLIDSQVLINGASDLGLSVAMAQVDEQIINDPNFQEDGQFNNQQFLRVLQSNGLNAEVYRRLIRKEFLIQQLYSGFVGAEFITKVDLDNYTHLINETRDVITLKVPIEKVRNGVTVSQDEIQSYYDANQNRFMTDERFIVEYVEVNRADFDQPISDQKVKEAYQKELKGFDGQGIYEISQIEIAEDGTATQATIDKIYSKLSEGTAFSELAKEYSDDLGSKNIGGKIGKGKADVFPSEFISAVSRLKAGEVAKKPIEFEGSLHIVRLDSFTEMTPPSFDERKDALKQEIMIAQSEPLFRNAEETLKDISFNALDLEEPAKAVKQAIKVTEPLTRVELGRKFQNRPIQNSLFSQDVLVDKRNTDVLEVTDGRLLVARIKEHILPKQKPLESVSEVIKKQLVTEKAKKLVDEKIAEATKALKSGDISPKALAKASDLQYSQSKGVKRMGVAGLPRPVITKAFELAAPKGEGNATIGQASLPNGDQLIVLVSNVQTSDEPISDAEKKSLKLILSQSKGNNLFQDYETHLKDTYKIKIK